MGAVATSQVERIEAAHARVQAAAVEFVGAAWDCGAELAAVKAGLPHGSFTAWCAEHLSFSQRTAQVYLQVHAKAQRAAVLEAGSVRAVLDPVGQSEPVDVRETGIRAAGLMGRYERLIQRSGELRRFQAETAFDSKDWTIPDLRDLPDAALDAQINELGDGLKQSLRGQIQAADLARDWEWYLDDLLALMRDDPDMLEPPRLTIEGVEAVLLKARAASREAAASAALAREWLADIEAAG